MLRYAFFSALSSSSTVTGSLTSSATLLGCEFANNFAGYSGGAIAMKSQSELNVVNCTLAENSADEAGGVFSESASSVSLSNSLLWNAPTDVVLLGKRVVQFCNIADGSFAGQNQNFSLNPHFVNASEGDYHLLPDSPCLDVGDANLDALPKTDIDGEPRILLGYTKLAPDIGADELDPETVFAVVNPQVIVDEGGLVTVNYSLWSGRAAPSSISAQYSADGGTTWHSATRALASETTDNLSTSANGRPHFFVWDSVADVGGVNIDSARIRVKPLAPKAHLPAATDAFSLDNSTADSDNDRLPDGWEQQIIDAGPNDLITAVANVLPDDDFDADGKTNRFEYLAGTSPIHATSSLNVEFFLEPDGRVNLRWPSVPGKSYTIYYCEGLGSQWLPVGPSQIGTGGVLGCTDDTATAGSRMRFYRLIVY